jgi:hypothetical protein
MNVYEWLPAIVLVGAASLFAQNGRSSHVVSRFAMGCESRGSEMTFQRTSHFLGIESVLSFATLERLLGDPSLEGFDESAPSLDATRHGWLRRPSRARELNPLDALTS